VFNVCDFEVLMEFMCLISSVQCLNVALRY